MTAPTDPLTEDSAGPPVTVAERVVRVLGMPLSARVAEAPDPRAVVVALHGGATHSVYFDHPGHPRLSLLRTAAALGFTTLALDRPGYGTSAPHQSELESAEHRTEVAWRAVDALLAGRERGAGVFVWGHSAGCELALRMAADDARGPDLLGLEIAGTGLEHHPGVLGALDAWGRDSPGGRTGLRRALWNPPDAYPPDVHGGRHIGAPSPAYEGRRREWREIFSSHAARVRVPVHITIAEHERVWATGPQALADLSRPFSAAPRVIAEEQAGAGHNTSVGRTALAYHLNVLSFVEECVQSIEGVPGLGGGDE
ncbi:alpha/beta hydrolase [Streptomyces yerevanensis]|uniref:alpha/beta hydrolase n=1 Tax=Streptomyces yerevanensis TaxID=66378 RepID=UPI0009966D11|nr:alpha/beta fold hydrolase [Streptomyces yerevanensis]